MARGSDNEGLARVSAKEKDNHKSGRFGSETKKLPGPVRIGVHNPTNQGGINRATRGSGAGKSDY